MGRARPDRLKLALFSFPASVCDFLPLRLVHRVAGVASSLCPACASLFKHPFCCSSFVPSPSDISYRIAISMSSNAGIPEESGSDGQRLPLQQPSRAAAERWLACPSHPRAELVRALASPVFRVTELLPLIQGRRDLSDGLPNLGECLLQCRVLLLPALLHQLAAPSVKLPVPERDADATSEERQHEYLRRSLFGACPKWLAQRYPPLVHAQIRRLWPEYNVSSVKQLIMEYFGDRPHCCFRLTVVARCSSISDLHSQLSGIWSLDAVR